jgi:ABC-type multidrug transport system ATPase subunit
VAVVGRNLTKCFRDLEAVRSISFDVPAGDDSILTNMP